MEIIGYPLRLMGRKLNLPMATKIFQTFPFRLEQVKMKTECKSRSIDVDDFCFFYVHILFWATHEPPPPRENFVPFSSRLFLTEAIQMGTAYLNIWMYVTQIMENAVENCQAGCTAIACTHAASQLWDSAVALYSGSLEGPDGTGDGVLLFALADAECQNFNTCGPLGNSHTGIAHVNLDIFSQFKQGQQYLLDGQCAPAVQVKTTIETMMAIPLIQGTIRTAYAIDKQKDHSEVTATQGAAFAATVLPFVYSCSETDGTLIYENMRLNGTSPVFDDVKAAFERNYACLGIQAEDIGGIWDFAESAYFPDTGSGTVKRSMGFLFGLVLVVVFRQSL